MPFVHICTQSHLKRHSSHDIIPIPIYRPARVIPASTTPKRRRLTPSASAVAELDQIEHAKWRDIILGDHAAFLLQYKPREPKPEPAHPRRFKHEQSLVKQALSYPTNTLTHSLLDRIVSTGKEGGVIPLFNRRFFLPPHCSFLLSSLQNLDPLVAQSPFDCIVADPPWDSHSVKRAGAYESLSPDAIASMPVRSMVHDGTLIAVWVTNNPRLIAWTRDTLLPAWGATCVGQWHWLKIDSCGGHPVGWIDSTHRKPYETLVLGRVGGGEAVGHVTIISVPALPHSRKPPLGALLAPLFRHDGSRLELFARGLTPGWTSWGNEVLLLQDVERYWQPICV